MPPTKSYIVPPEVFEKYDADQKMNTMFYYIATLHDNAEAARKETKDCIDDLKRKIDRRTWTHRSLAAAAGGFGGAVAMVFKYLFSGN